MDDVATHPFEVAEAIYYAAVFVVAFLSGVSQTLRSRDFIDCRHGFNIGLVSGFLAFAIVAFIDGSTADRAGDEFFYLGIAALIGLSVKQQDRILRALWGAVAEKFGISDLDPDMDITCHPRSPPPPKTNEPESPTREDNEPKVS